MYDNYWNLFYLLFDWYPCIHKQFDLCTSSAHKLSTVSVHHTQNYRMSHLLSFCMPHCMHATLYVRVCNTVCHAVWHGKCLNECHSVCNAVSHSVCPTACHAKGHIVCQNICHIALHTVCHAVFHTMCSLPVKCCMSMQFHHAYRRWAGLRPSRCQQCLVERKLWFIKDRLTLLLLFAELLASRATLL